MLPRDVRSLCPSEVASIQGHDLYVVQRPTRALRRGKGKIVPRAVQRPRKR